VKKSSKILTTMPQHRRRRSPRVLLPIALVLIAAPRCFAAIQTTTWRYHYNADGALTAITTQVDGQAATTTYLTWDNFVPSTVAPTTGTVVAGNGNLSGVGPTPGGTYATQFQYDQRNRLTNVTAIGAQSVAYSYYPASLMASSTLASGDTLQFYYDAAPISQVANITQPSTATWSSYLGDATYLSNGTEQIRCQPRKDVAGVYEPAQQSFSSNRYDPYGASVNGASSVANDSQNDMSQNPFRFAGEYQDQSGWGGYYLRARWYLPEYQIFLQRDTGDRMHRYSYTAGNPIGRVDPSGLHSAEAGARTFLRDLHAGGNGLRAALARLFLGGIIGTAQIIANPSGYWHGLKHDTGGIDVFLAAGVLTEVGSSGWFGLPELPGSTLASFGARHLVDASLGAGQSIASGFTEHGRYDWATVAQGVEYTVGGMFEAREAAGIGYKPFGMTTDDLDKMTASHFHGNDNVDQALVFRVRYKDAIAFTTPWMEKFHVGNYHESVLAVGHDGVWLGQVNIHTIDGAKAYTTDLNWSRLPDDVSTPSHFIGTGGTTRQLRFVGTISQRAVKDAFTNELSLAGQDALRATEAGRNISVMPDYNKLTNNCQQYSARIRRNMITFERNPVEAINDD
jgi:RHS repeat-associated protein